MRCLNKDIARRANREDTCKGAFWEGRFKSLALLDEQALLACMMYVELNPIRADIADTVQTSDFTQIQQRITEFKAPEKSTKPMIEHSEISTQTPLKPLVQSDGSTHLGDQAGILFHFCDYLTLIDWTGRAIRPDKTGYIDSSQPKLLNELCISADAWITSAKAFRSQYGSVSGRWDAMCKLKTALKW